MGERELEMQHKKHKLMHRAAEAVVVLNVVRSPSTRAAAQSQALHYHRAALTQSISVNPSEVQTLTIMSLELEENIPTTEEEDEEEEEEEEGEEEEDATPSKRAPSKRNKGAAVTPAKKKSKKKKNQPGRYSQLVVDTIRKLGERNGSSLAKIYSEAKKVSWFDQQNGRTYLKYSIKALVQNDTLLQVKGIGANGSFRLNKKKLEGLPAEKKAAPAKPAAKKKAAPVSTPKRSHKKAKSKPKPKKEKPKKAVSSPKPAPKSSKKKAASGGSKKVKKTAKPSVPKVPKSKKA
ncbi:histone H1.10-like [Pelobates fuscus]|uniref:histone H1.10-like n=1 Tax=Pelobates fuscus TaxID=191477 RepID=UPI002FE4C715